MSFQTLQRLKHICIYIQHIRTYEYVNEREIKVQECDRSCHTQENCNNDDDCIDNQFCINGRCIREEKVTRLFFFAQFKGKDW